MNAPLTIETLIREHAATGGMSDALIELWLDADENRALGCSPRRALEQGRVNQVLAVLDAFMGGRALPSCTFPSCRCEWSRRYEHCPRFGGETKGDATRQPDRKDRDESS